MLSALVGYIWNSSVLIEAFCTILFLVLIRMYSRDISSSKSTNSKSPMEKVAEKIGDKIGDVNKEVKDVIEELTASPSSTKKEDTPIPPTNQLDIQFYGELFLASVLSSSAIKIWWR